MAKRNNKKKLKSTSTLPQQAATAVAVDIDTSKEESTATTTTAVADHDHDHDDQASTTISATAAENTKRNKKKKVLMKNKKKKSITITNRKEIEAILIQKKSMTFESQLLIFDDDDEKKSKDVCNPKSSSSSSSLSSETKRKLSAQPPPPSSSSSSSIGEVITITPWRDMQELCEVHDSIYSAITFVMQEYRSSDYGKRATIIMPNGVEMLHFAREKLTVWRIRARNITRTQFLTSHLIAIESMLNVLLEEHQHNHQNNSNNGGGGVGAGSSSSLSLLQLYSMCVINFFSALTIHAKELNLGSISLRFISNQLNIPQWIMDARNALSHDTTNLPSRSLLAEAISFALEWMDRMFWYKIIHNTTTGSDEQNKNQQQQLEQSPPSRDSVHRDTCLLLFTGSDQWVTYKRNVKQFIQKYPQEYLQLFTEILVFVVPNHENIKPTSYHLPPLLLRRSATLFKTIFTTIPPEYALISLFNQLVGHIEHAEQLCKTVNDDDPLLENYYQARHSGHCWLNEIVDGLTYRLEAAMAVATPEPKRTMFRQSLECFGANLSKLRQQYAFALVRLLYRICKLTPNRNTYTIVKRFCDHLIDPIVMPHSKQLLVLQMLQTFTMSTSSSDLAVAKSIENNSKSNSDSNTEQDAEGKMVSSSPYTVKDVMTRITPDDQNQQKHNNRKILQNEDDDFYFLQRLPIGSSCRSLKQEST